MDKKYVEQKITLDNPKRFFTVPKRNTKSSLKRNFVWEVGLDRLKWLDFVNAANKLLLSLRTVRAKFVRDTSSQVFLHDG